MSWKSAKKTTAKEAMGLMENGNALFIDVRLPMHYQKVLIKGL
jgi:rhodanese-related sulfurtransferase